MGCFFIKPAIGAKLCPLLAALAITAILWPATALADRKLPPSIVTQPTDLAVPAYQNAGFFVSAAGTAPLSYQWRFNGTDIAGATDTNLVVITATSSNAGAYSVQVTNAQGSVISSNATLTVNYPPIILVHPVSQAALLGSNVAFQVIATGTPAFGHRWQLNGVPVPGGTNATLAISAVQSNNVGAYTAVVTNAGGATTSHVATLSIATPPDFLWARGLPNYSAEVDYYGGASAGGPVASDASGNVFVAGTFFNWSMDFGGFTLTNNTFDMNASVVFLAKYDRWGNFQWVQQVGTNNAYWLGGSPNLRVGTDSSGNCYLAGWFAGTATFGTNVFLTTNPLDLFVAKYDPQGQALWGRRIVAAEDYHDYVMLGFAVDAAGDSVLSSRYTNAADFGTVTITNSPAFLAKYDSSGNLLWALPSLTGYAIAVGSSGSIFVTGNAGSSVGYPDDQHFDVLAKYDSSGGLLWWRWFPKGRAIAVDAAENIYATGSGIGSHGDVTITNVVGWQADFFVAKCDSNGQTAWLRQIASVAQQTGMGIAVDALGKVYVTSTSANKFPEPVLVIGGSVLTNIMSFVAKYDGDGNALWAKSLCGNGIGGGQPSGMAFTDPQQIYVAGAFNYKATYGVFNLTNDNPAHGDDFYLTKLAAIESAAPPLITAQPQSQIVAVGANVSFNVTASGAVPLAYQWFFNGTNAVFGATNSAFTVTNAQLANSGSYSVTVTNGYGSATSALATLTVHPPPPLITAQPQSLAVTIGADAAFQVTASSDAPLAYQWFFNATNSVAGATSSAFTVTNAKLANSGSYSAIVTNAYGSATSALAMLTVYPADGGTLIYNSDSNRQFRFTVRGLPGLKYAVEASSNLMDWIFVSTNTSPFLFTDPYASNFARRFYRSVYIP